MTGKISNQWYSDCGVNADAETIRSWFVQIFNQDVSIDDLAIWLPTSNCWASQEQIDNAIERIDAGI
jgi:hypothetical protein